MGDSTVSLNIGYGFTTKAWDCYCAIIVYSKHINISFPAGAFLEDPEGIFHGFGKKIRHIKIKTFNDIKAPAVEDLLSKARQRALSLIEEKPSGNYTTKTIVKPILGIKKRLQ